MHRKRWKVLIHPWQPVENLQLWQQSPRSMQRRLFALHGMVVIGHHNQGSLSDDTESRRNSVNFLLLRCLQLVLRFRTSEQLQNVLN
jgi:hypothetical protein